MQKWRVQYANMEGSPSVLHTASDQKLEVYKASNKTSYISW